MPTIIEELRKLSSRSPEQRESEDRKKKVRAARPGVQRCVARVIEVARTEAANSGGTEINAKVWSLSRNDIFSPELFCELVASKLVTAGFSNIRVRPSSDCSDVPVIRVAVSWRDENAHG